jgi:hypothetical protein
MCLLSARELATICGHADANARRWQMRRRMQLIPATQDKLDEARFFLGEMRNAKRARADAAVFGHYLSAFISAARSVPWVLGNEQSEKYKAWEPAWKAGLSRAESEFLTFMNERRLDEVKRTGANTKIDWKFISIFDLPAEEYRAFGGHSVPALTLEAARLGRPSVGRPTHRFAAGDEPDVIASCERWLVYLEKTVSEFMRSHSSV